MSADRATRWRAGRPGHGREFRTRPEALDAMAACMFKTPARAEERRAAALAARAALYGSAEGYYPEVHVDDDPDVDAAVERRAALDELVRLSKQHGLYPDDDGWEDQ